MDPASIQMHPTNSRNQSILKEFLSPSSTNPLCTPPSTNSTRPLLSSRSNSKIRSSQQLLPSGLQLNASNYPLYSTDTSSYPIRILSASQYADIQKEYNELILEEKVLMPWCHGGADIAGSNAAHYFGFGRGEAAVVPNYCGLTVLCADPLKSDANEFRNRATSLSSFSSGSSSSSHFSSSSIGSTSSIAATPAAILTSSFSASHILNNRVPATFKFPLKLSPTVNLRGFNLQAVKYASVSDIVIYGRNGVDENVIELAKRVGEAMESIRRERKNKGQGREERYNVYIIEDSFSTFERDYPELVAIDSAGFQRNKLNFFEREREEMRVLTQASEIAENVWLGNSQDVPIASYRSSSPPSSDSSSSLSSLDDGNPLSFSICIEAHDQAVMSDERTLRRIGDGLDDLEDLIGGFEDVYLTDNKSNKEEPIDGTHSVKILRPSVTELIHLEASSTGGVCGRISAQRALITSTINLILWLRSQATPATPDRLPRRILIHCGDGYTETSLLALSYVMLVRRCSLPDAYLFLQRDADRSFFVYPKDVGVLERIERVIREILEDELAASLQLGEDMKRSDSGFASNSSSSPNLSSSTSSFDKFTSAEVAMSSSTPKTHPWFYSPSFEGHFPSRILPFLYLGNLAHATNALMLKELGITHVVSMGESAMIPPKSTVTSIDGRPSLSNTPTNSLWLESRLGNISVLDLKDIADDGIDSLEPYLLKAIAFIDEAQKSGGTVLVHCKVGVSRSSSIVIGYLIKYLELDLSSAYLLTRSRRLNILIQPNLPFLLTLHALEGTLLKSKKSQPIASADLGRAGLKKSNRLAFSFLCSEIASLNERFLC